MNCSDGYVYVIRGVKMRSNTFMSLQCEYSLSDTGMEGVPGNTVNKNTCAAQCVLELIIKI